MRLLLAVLLGIASVGTVGATAWAHGGGAVIDAAVDVSPAEVAVTADIAYEADGHAAESARVRAVLLDAAGAEVAGADLPAVGPPGRYAASIAAPPGVVAVRVTSAFPPGTSELVVEGLAPGEASVAAPASSPTPVPLEDGQVTAPAADDVRPVVAPDAGTSIPAWAWPLAAVGLLGGVIIGWRLTTGRRARVG